jgi:hypothetical protein
VEATGATLDKTNHTQLLTAINALITAALLPAYRRLWHASGATTPGGFASGSVAVGRVSAFAGAFTSPGGRDYANSWLYSINVYVASTGTITIPVPQVETGMALYVDGTLVGSVSGGHITWTSPTVGNHLVQFVHTTLTEDIGITVVGDWIDGANIQFASTPT